MDKLDGSLQENLLVLLCFSDEHARHVANLVELQYFDPLYKEIATKAYAFIEEFKCAPKDHIADEFATELEGDDKRGTALARVLQQLYEARETVNAEYTLSRIELFIKKQSLLSSVMEAANALNFDSNEALAVAQGVLRGALKERPDLLTVPLEFGDVGAVLKYIEGVKDPSFPTGIEALDRHSIGPIRKGLHLFIALYGHGKSWYMINLGKHALISRQKVLHITLEMGADEVLARYYQTFFGISKHRIKKDIKVIESDSYGNHIDIEDAVVTPKIAFEDHDHAEKIKKRLKAFGRRHKLKVIQLSQPSIQQMEAYLDHLEASMGFKPDLLIVDYADLMKTTGGSHQDSSSYRIALGEIYKDLRSIAIERDIAVVTASQANRTSVSDGIKLLGGDSVAEDFSKVATADTVVTYNQTKAEKFRNLARLYVAKSRQSEDKFTVLIAQNYDMGQFALSSARLRDLDRYKAGLKDD